jgi:hypothetical protein
MLPTHILLDFFRKHFPLWDFSELHLEIKNRTLRIICQNTEMQKRIFREYATLSRLDIGFDLFLICCSGYPSMGIYLQKVP